MSFHRIVNNVGYKKIYPMSLSKDDGFCHYCGRLESTIVNLEWDHVPALNVKIPTEYGIEFGIKKVLVRLKKIDLIVFMMVWKV